jgi:cytochrome aa3-600 menaquinol oxidase subunit 1
MWFIAAFSLIGVFFCMAHRSFEIDPGHYISVEEIKETEAKYGGSR